MTVFFAAGNWGNNGNGMSTISSDASAKNVIAVGSTETPLGGANNSWIAYYSSHGPTYDGRFKPDIVTPGDSLMSAHAAGSSSQTCDTVEMAGNV